MASIAERPDGRWRARYRDEAGKEHAKHFKLKRDAQRWLDEITATIVTGLYVDPKAGNLTFSKWFETWRDLQVWEQGTRDAADVSVVGLPFADIPLNKIKPTHVQSWVRDMQKKGLAASTIKTRFNYVHMAFRAAVGERILRDPSKLATRGSGTGIKLPKLPRSTSLEIPTPEQVGGVYRAAGESFQAFIAVCAFAGLRLGEAAGLQLGDVDFLGRTLKVERQLQGQTRARTRETGPKAMSARTIPIPEVLTIILSEHVRRWGTHGDDGWLFTSDGEHLFTRNAATYRWREAAKRASVDGFTLHDLRHYYASGLIAAGCDVVTVQKALGHSAPSITLNVYSHLWPDSDDRTRTAAASLAGAALNPADRLRTKAAE